MPSRLKTLMIYLAVFALGSAQLFGIQAGYLCECTGEHSIAESCEKAECHHERGDHDTAGESPGTLISASGHEEAPSQRDHQHQHQHQHQHSEVRKALPLTGMPSLGVLPLPPLFDLPPSFQRAQVSFAVASAPSVRERMHPPDP